ncbi:MAG: NAD-dependent succinate-semialdehyde dehydrogenase [Marmoricola sp.]
MALPQTLIDYIASLDAAHGLCINGKREGASSGKTFAVTDPATGAHLADVPDADESDAKRAVDAADAAFKAWAATAPRERSEILRRTFELMHAESENLAALMSAENGKSLPDARAEVTYAAEFFRWFAEEAVRLEGEYMESPAGGTRTIVTSRPIGIAALATPWNFPAAMATRKIGPALAAGCTVVLKPASETPLTVFAIYDILLRAGVPAGVVNVVPTTDPNAVMGGWLADERVRMVSFTGSTRVGSLLLSQAAARIVTPAMELGGNAPFVVHKDADIEQAVAGAMIAKFRNGGQACTAANRFYVHEDVKDAFVDAFGRELESLRVGSAFENDNQIGPLISHRAVDGVTRLVNDALDRGAKIAYQAPAPEGGDGSFYPPTLLVDVPEDADVVLNEIFGPVVPIVTYTDDEALVEQLNRTEFGLASYIYSGNLAWALHTAERTEAGMVGINRGIVSDPAAPFGGVKQSGIGREGAHEGVKEFREIQYFSVAW